MENDNIDGLTKPKLKAKYLTLVKVNTQLEEENKLLVNQVQAKSNSLVALVEKLQEHVKCPVCLEVPTFGPIWSCPRGHLVCQACFQGLKNVCPLCRSRMANTVSLLANTVIKNIEHRCKFETEGCKAMSGASEVEEHRRICNFRPIDCPSYYCKSKVPFDNLVDHILNKCKNSFAKASGGKHRRVAEEGEACKSLFHLGRGALVSGIFPRTSVTTFAWKDKFFFLNQVPEASHWNFYIQMLGTEEECERVTVAITVGEQTGQHFVKFSSNPFPVEMSEEDLKAGGMKVRIKTLKKICVPSSSDPETLDYNIFLNFADETSGS